MTITRKLYIKIDCKTWKQNYLNSKSGKGSSFLCSFEKKLFFAGSSTKFLINEFLIQQNVYLVI